MVGVDSAEKFIKDQNDPAQIDNNSAEQEPVRLVIWDLDETFWAGTLTEGGITHYIEHNHTLVKVLAERGIISSICSRNDFDTVQRVLSEKGLWDYFVFPSINWLPKPERVVQIIENMQLRPQTVMFIDDNPSNLAAVLERIPGIRVKPEIFIGEIANSPLFRGKDDRALTRLKQYKLLETRSRDQSAAGDNIQFLRESQIQVIIEVDLEPHFARIVELVNRTNQLNFTKSRFSDSESEAVQELKRQLQPSHEVTAGVVHVKDRYGDYGYCGFYLQRWGKIEHFCFSCRILGFGVESWLYQKLGRPNFSVVGDVLTDLAASKPVDWINAQVAEAGPDSTIVAGKAKRIGIIAHCEGGMIGHYLRLNGYEVIGEGLHNQNCLTLVGDSLANLYYRSASRWEQSCRWFERLGFLNLQPYEQLGGNLTRAPVVVFSHRDFRGFSYRHKSEDFSINVALSNFSGDICDASKDFLETLIRKQCENNAEYELVINTIAFLRENFETVPILSNEMLELQRGFLTGLCEETMGQLPIFAVMKSSKIRNEKSNIVELEGISIHRNLILETASRYTNLVPIDIENCLISDDEIVDTVHYDRIVYYRLSKLINEKVSKFEI